MRGELRAMLHLGTKLDLSDALEWMRAHGSSVLLNWGEDDNLWECSVITGGDRYTGLSNREPINAVLDCIKKILEEAPSYDD